jgi:hypothetical protein
VKLFGLPASIYVRALLSGRIGHWADTNDAVLTETARRIEAFQDPLRLIFRELLLASNATAEQLVGYQRSIRLLTPDQKTLSGEHFRHLYSVLLSYFAAVSYTVNPFLKEHLASALPQVAPNGDAVAKYLRDAEVEKRDYEDDDGSSLVPAPADAESLATLAWKHLADGFPGVDVGDMAILIGFKLVVSQEAIVSLGRIKTFFV